MGLYFTIREKLRFNPLVNKIIYLSQSLYPSYFGRLAKDVRRAGQNATAGNGVALCLRFRDEARFLPEWLEYYLAAGVDHFYLYNNFSEDGFRSVIRPWVDTGLITLVDWPRVPASPTAEEDCIRRALGRFAWVGFLDADEFVVIRDGRSIGAFLEPFRRSPGVALNWRMFGSSHLRARPLAPVIVAYQHRATAINTHVKAFVQPGRVAQCRNSHSWYYNPIATAVGEHGNRIYGSLNMNPTADCAWINHYYFKSEQDYLEKAARRSVIDRVTIRFPSRKPERVAGELAKNNDVFDSCAADYYRARCQALGCRPELLNQVPVTDAAHGMQT
ncbi:MAG: glycosyltransferase family 92 protein [Acidobacteriaceae bacterium]